MNWFAIATCSALLSAGSAITQKKILFRLKALEFSFLVSGVILIFSLFVPFATDVFAIPAVPFLILVAKSLLGGMAFLFVMMSLERNQISSALPLLGTTPGVAAMLALMLLGESLKPWEWAGLGLMLAGTYTLEMRPHQKMFQPIGNLFRSKNYWFIYGAVALFSISSVGDRVLVTQYKITPLVVLFYQHLVYFGLFGIQLLLRKHSIPDLVEKGRSQYPLILGVALLTLGYRFTQLEATKLAPIALVLAVKRTSILYASFFGGKIFSDERLLMKCFAGAMIVAAGFIILRNVG